MVKWSSFIWPAALLALDNFDFGHYSWKAFSVAWLNTFHWYFDYRSLSWIQSPSLNSPARVQPFRSHQSPHSSDNWLKVGRDSNCLIIGCKIFSWVFSSVCVIRKITLLSWSVTNPRKSWTIWPNRAGNTNTKETSSQTFECDEQYGLIGLEPL